MVKETERKTNAILQIIAATAEPIGSAEIAERLKEQGIMMSERTVRYHLKTLSDKGLLKVFWKEGRVITSKGREELSDSLVFDKVGLMSARIEAMAYQLDFDLENKSGNVILNISFIPEAVFSEALKLMRPVFEKKYATSDLVLTARNGEELAGIKVPEGKVAFGTLCSINLNGILLKHSIPVASRFGGILQIEGSRPVRFTEIIDYNGSTLDPHEIFIRSRMTSVGLACQGAGKILAGLREIPAAAASEAEALIRRSEAAGLGRALLLGRSGQMLLGVPVGMERVGLVVPGGLNPLAVVEEQGINTESKALVSFVDYQRLVSFWDLK